MIPYARHELGPEEIAAVVSSLHNDCITRGAHVEALEKAFCDTTRAKHAVAFNSGSSALFAAASIFNPTCADQVLVPANTFVSTLGVFAQQGVVPRLLDIDTHTGLWNHQNLLEQIENSTCRGKTFLMPVHFGGAVAQLPPQIHRLVKEQRLFVIEDGACALGGTYGEGSRVGSCSHAQITMFSLHPAKIVTSGEGGVLTTNCDDLADKLRRFRNNGIERTDEKYPGYYTSHCFSGNYHMTEMQAALGCAQMKKLWSFLEKRKALVAHYRTCLTSLLGVTPLEVPCDTCSSHQLFVVLLEVTWEQKKKLMEWMKQQGIGTQVHYIPLYHHRAFVEKYGNISACFPSTETYFRKALTLPLYPSLSFKDVEHICDVLDHGLRHIDDFSLLSSM